MDFFLLLRGCFLLPYRLIVSYEASLNVRPYVCPSVNKTFSNSNQIWYVGRGQWVIHDGMPYVPIHGQGRGGLKVAKMTDFKVSLLCQYACNSKD